MTHWTGMSYIGIRAGNSVRRSSCFSWCWSQPWPAACHGSPAVTLHKVASRAVCSPCRSFGWLIYSRKNTKDRSKTVVTPDCPRQDSVNCQD
jgi:hypothetical protein